MIASPVMELFMRNTRVALAAALATAATTMAVPATAAGQEDLCRTVAELDAAAFEAFNRCADPAQLEKYASYFAADVEFCHDTGGVTWTRDDMIAGTRRNVCGTFGRDLVPGSLKVYPIAGYGARAP